MNDQSSLDSYVEKPRKSEVSKLGQLATVFVFISSFLVACDRGPINSVGVLTREVVPTPITTPTNTLTSNLKSIESNEQILDITYPWEIGVYIPHSVFLKDVNVTAEKLSYFIPDPEGGLAAVNPGDACITGIKSYLVIEGVIDQTGERYLKAYISVADDMERLKINLTKGAKGGITSVEVADALIQRYSADGYSALGFTSGKRVVSYGESDKDGNLTVRYMAPFVVLLNQCKLSNTPIEASATLTSSVKKR